MIWARSEIQQIADRLAVAGDDDLMAQGLEIALNYNLVSDWTSFVAIDASEVVEQPGDRTEVVPVPVPEGVNYETTVKER
jgi:Ca-activated chloride channel family protein